MRNFFLGLALAFAAPAAAAALSEADRADVARAEDYLNTVKTISGRFVQVAPDGSLSEGRMWLSRPGRLRFEYAPPTPILVVADGIFVVYHDMELGQVDRVPIDATPLSVLLSERVKLSGDVTVRAVRRGPGTLRVALFATKRPDEGEIVLVFGDNPLQLRQWQVVDARGGATTVSLSQLEFNQPLVNRLFVFTDPPRKQDSR
jgi:outer membrane lipoprotein-sorting protein